MVTTTTTASNRRLIRLGRGGIVRRFIYCSASLTEIEGVTNRTTIPVGRLMEW